MDQHNRRTRKKLSNYLEGKRVAIVGPAACIVDSEQAELINSYDVVVRLNKALPIPNNLKKDVGTRTDILYNCMNPNDDCGGVISIKQLRQHKVKFLIGAYPPVDRVGSTKLRIKKDVLEFWAKNRSAFQNFCYTDKGYFLKIWKHMRLANTGTIAILDLLRFNIKELYITGITFFKGGYIRTYRDYDEKGILDHLSRFELHKPSKQLDYACRQLMADKRVKMDETLEKIIHKRYHHLTKNKTIDEDTKGKEEDGDKKDGDKKDGDKKDGDKKDGNKKDGDKKDGDKKDGDKKDGDKKDGDKKDGDKKDDDGKDLDYSDETLDEMASSSVQIYIKEDDDA